jgi:hypothetical protein
MTPGGGMTALLTSHYFRVKPASLLEQRVFAVLRDDFMDIEMTELETFVPGRIFVLPIKLKTKTPKTP